MSWKTVELGNLCEVLDNRRKPVTKCDRIKGEFPYYGATGIVDYVDNYIFDEKLVLVGEDGAKWESGEKTAFIVNGKYWVNNHAHVIKPKRDLLLDEWLVYYFFYKDLKEFITGLTVPKLNMGQLKIIPIPLPPLPIQQKIVEKLDKIFAEIDNATAIAEINAKNAEALFQSYLRQVFEHEGKEWKRIKVKDLGRVQSGGTPSIPKKEYWGGDVEWFSSGELNDLYTLSSTRKITFEGIKNSNAKIFPANSLLIGMYDTAAMKMSLLSKPATFNQAIVGIEPTQKINMIFLYYALTFIKPYVLSLRRGVRQKNLSLAKIKELSIQFPKVDIQLRVSKRLDLFKGLSRKLSNVYLDKINQHIKIKNSILKQAFNGELFKAA